jgi:hypothetical protein
LKIMKTAGYFFLHNLGMYIIIIELGCHKADHS